MRFLITQSLLSSWLYQWNQFAGDNAQENFIKSLKRESIEQTEAMLNGIAFEQLITDIIEKKDVSSNINFINWGESATKIAEEIQGGQLQLAAKKQIEVEGVNLLLYGRLDCLKAGTIYDIKFSKAYEVGKYYESVQHSMYFELIPEAKRFVYLVSNGKKIWKETYLREEHKPIIDTVTEFINYIKLNNLYNMYCENWHAMS